MRALARGLIVAAAFAGPLAHAELYYLIVGGLGGEVRYEERFAAQTASGAATVRSQRTHMLSGWMIQTRSGRVNVGADWSRGWLSFGRRSDTQSPMRAMWRWLRWKRPVG